MKRSLLMGNGDEVPTKLATLLSGYTLQSTGENRLGVVHRFDKYREYTCQLALASFQPLIFNRAGSHISET